MEVKNKYEHDVENGTSTLIIKQYKENQLIATHRYIIPIEFVDQVSKHTWNVSPRVSTPVVTLDEYKSTHKALGLNNITPFVRIYTDATYKYAVSSKNKYKYAENDKHLYKTNSCELAINNFTYHIDKLITGYEEISNDYFEINYNSQGRKFINIKNGEII
jgi:16S rRNA A1518/A1519 N6-dimethyltransferase RsmA/KsgA/DIM1 with predicted DNA glycosylase/AP lyase activity